MKQNDPNKAVDYIIANSTKYAEAKANRVYIEEFRKSKKALLMNQCDESTVNAREQFAYSHPEYIQLLEGLKVAVGIEESLKWQMEAARLRIEIWRTQEASNRSTDRTMR